MLSRLLVGLGVFIRLLTYGNTKLGKIHIWSLPAVVSCPGSSALCRASCYARKGYYNYSSVIERLYKNLAMASSPFFVAWMIKSIQRQKAVIVRIHSAGDFHTTSYIRAWLSITRACPEVRFYAYTRSWRIPELRPMLTLLSQQPNFRMWYSVDRETGVPNLTEQEGRVKLAHMAVDVNDIAVKPVDLVFRDYNTRNIVQKHVHGSLVCPVENGTGAHMTCEKCQVCFNDSKTDKLGSLFQHVSDEPRPRGRVPLQLAS